jgi:hypothetical protein
MSAVAIFRGLAIFQGTASTPTPDADNRDSGMASAEYAVGTLAACGFGTVLYKILTSDSVAGLLGNLIKRVLELVLG